MGLVLGAVAGLGFGLYQSVGRLALRDLTPVQATFLQVLLGGIVLVVPLSSVGVDDMRSFSLAAVDGLVPPG